MNELRIQLSWLGKGSEYWDRLGILYNVSYNKNMLAVWRALIRCPEADILSVRVV